MLIQLLPLNQAPMTTHAPARGQSTGQQQMKKPSNTGGKFHMSLATGGAVLGTVNTFAKTISNVESLNKTFHDITGNKGNTTEGASAVEQPDDRAVTAEHEPGNSSLNVENHEYADGRLEGYNNDDPGLYYGQGDEEIAGVGVDGEVEWEGTDYGYPEQDEYNGGDQGVYHPDYEDQGQEYEYDGGNQEAYNPQDGGIQDTLYPQDGGIQDACYPQDGGIQDTWYPQDGGIQDACYPQDGGIQDTWYPQDGGIQETFNPQDGGIQDAFDPQDGGILDAFDGDNGGIWADFVDAISNW